MIINNLKKIPDELAVIKSMNIHLVKAIKAPIRTRDAYFIIRDMFRVYYMTGLKFEPNDEFLHKNDQYRLS